MKWWESSTRPHFVSFFFFPDDKKRTDHVKELLLFFSFDFQWKDKTRTKRRISSERKTKWFALPCHVYSTWNEIGRHTRINSNRIFLSLCNNKQFKKIVFPPQKKYVNVCSYFFSAKSDTFPPFFFACAQLYNQISLMRSSLWSSSFNDIHHRLSR